MKFCDFCIDTLYSKDNSDIVEMLLCLFIGLQIMYKDSL